MAESEDFEKMLRRALNHLYEPGVLRSSPLVTLFGLEGTNNPAAALRTALEKAIEALGPTPSDPAGAKSRRFYDLLGYRYVEQLPQKDAANRLGITARHLRREQSAAIHALANHLRLQFDLLDQIGQTSEAAGESDMLAITDTEVNREMLWLAESLADQSTEVDLVLREATQLASRLAQENSVTLDLELSSHLPPAAIAGTVLKQIVLNLAMAAIASAPEGELLLTASEQAHTVGISIISRAVDEASWHPWEWDGERVAVSQRLLELFNGELAVSLGEKGASARVSIPRADRVRVLAVEDNEDTLQLWQRFLRYTRFYLEGMKEPERALARAAELHPDLIILDVMLPKIDGWELLGELQRHPATATIPVIVCTVLPQQELARSLGASGFIRKPVTGQEFRAELERQIEAARHE